MDKPPTLTDQIARIDARLERMEGKIDAALSLSAVAEYVKYAVIGAWAAIGALFVTK